MRVPHTVCASNPILIAQAWLVDFEVEHAMDPSRSPSSSWKVSADQAVGYSDRGRNDENHLLMENNGVDRDIDNSETRGSGNNRQLSEEFVPETMRLLAACSAYGSPDLE